tara:strand:- start:1009 stop:1377 length:369 start_codon:yes stop_codon:yes gene_type:complete
MTKDLMKTQLIGLASHLNKIINRVNGDDFSPSLIDEIKNSLKALDNNSASQEIDKEHFDKLILLCQDTCKRLIKTTEYMSHLNIRYTSKDANTKLLDKILDDFSVYEVKVYEEVLKEPKKRV